MDPIMKAVKAVHTVAASGASVSAEDLEKQRNAQDLFARLATPGVGISNNQIMVDNIPAEWLRPDFCHEKKHVILYCHGGGYTCGSLKYARILASKLSLHTGLEVLSFQYRLSPENPYPAAIEDAMAVWDYLMKLGYGARDVLVAGDSAGGNLALELCLQLKKEGRFKPRALILMSPWTDMTITAKTYETCLSKDPMLTPEYVKAVRGAYAGSDVDFLLPEYSPLYADLEGFPPTLIQVGTNEILLDDSRQLAKKMQKAGVFVKLEVYDDGWHVFQQLPIRRAYRAMEAIGGFTQSVL